MVHENQSGQSTTVITQNKFTLDLTGLDNSTVYVTVDVDYMLGQQTSGFLEVVDAAELDARPTLINLAQINVPALAVPITSANIVLDDPTYPRVLPFAKKCKKGFFSQDQFKSFERLKDTFASELVGGVVKWEKPTSSTLEWTSDLTIRLFRKSFTYTVAAQAITLADDEVAFVKLSDSAGGILTVNKVARGSFEFDDNVTDVLHYPLFYRDGTRVFSPFGEIVLDSGEENVLGEDLPQDIRTKLGITSETLFETFLSTIFIEQADSVPTAISKLDTDMDYPLRLFATDPPDGILNINPSHVKVTDGSEKTVGPQSDLVPIFDGGAIDFQSQLTSGVIDIVFPGTTVGLFRRAGMTLISDGTLKVIFSDAAVVSGSLADPGTLFDLVSGGDPAGWIDLESTDASGDFKTIGSVSGIIENDVGGDARIHSIIKSIPPTGAEGFDPDDILVDKVTGAVVTDKITGTVVLRK